MSDEQNLLTRRQSFGLAGLTRAAFVAGCSRRSGGDAGGSATTSATGETPSCVLVPEVTEGPYFLDERLNRSDVRANSSGGGVRHGIPLRLKITVVDVGAAGACTPYEGAAVDIWHSDAEGVYSGVENPGNAGGAGTDFLRGYQVTNAQGAAIFRTIFPGWYRGRAIHIHVKVRVFDGSQQTFEYTSQLFFAETTIDQVYAREPHSSNGKPDTPNNSDGIYGEMGGTGLVRMSGSAAAGYSGAVTLGISGLPKHENEDASASTSR